MPPMTGAGIVASQAKLDIPLVSSMIDIGILIGLSTAPGLRTARTQPCLCPVAAQPLDKKFKRDGHLRFGIGQSSA